MRFTENRVYFKLSEMIIERDSIMKKLIAAASVIVAITGSTVYAGGQTFDPSLELDTPAVSDSIPDWSGFYMGLQGGYGWRNLHMDFTPLPVGTFGVSSASRGFDLSGGICGGQLGYLWQVGEDLDYIAGAESSLDVSTITGLPRSQAAVGSSGIYAGSTYNHIFTGSEKMPMFGSLRPILGFLMDEDAWLIYGTGGMSYAYLRQAGDANFSSIDGHTYPEAKNIVQLGWVAGGGCEWKFARHVSGGLEYLYYDLGSVGSAVNAQPANNGYQMRYVWTYQENVLTVNLNYRFL